MSDGKVKMPKMLIIHNGAVTEKIIAIHISIFASGGFFE